MTGPRFGPDSIDPDVAVILPAYNEELTIADTIAAFHKALPAAAIYVINNRSSDSTAAIAVDVLADLGCRGTVIDELAPGKGNAVRRAFLAVDADIYVMADADMTYPADEVDLLLEPIISGRADMVVGDRISSGHYHRENKRKAHNLGNAVINATINGLFHADLRDVTSGFRAFTRQFVRTYPILVDGFEIESDLSMHALHNRARIIEVPITYVDRPAGSASKLRTVSDGARVLFTIAQIVRFYRPLAFFGAIAALFLTAGLLAGTPAIVEYAQDQYVRRVPLAILAAGLCLIASVCLGIGLTLDSIARNERLAFEQRWMDFAQRHRR